MPRPVLEDLLEVVEGRGRHFVVRTGNRELADGAVRQPIAGEQAVELRPEALAQAPLVDADHDREQRVREEQLDGLQNVDDLIGLAAIEIVDKEHDAIDRCGELFERCGLRRLVLSCWRRARRGRPDNGGTLHSGLR